MSMGGYTLNFDEQWVLLFKRVGDKVQLVRRNVRFRAKPGSAVAKAVEVTYTDSILKALPIITINSPLLNHGIHSVRADHYQQGLVATEHCIRRGHRAIPPAPRTAPPHPCSGRKRRVL